MTRQTGRTPQSKQSNIPSHRKPPGSLRSSQTLRGFMKKSSLRNDAFGKHNFDSREGSTFSKFSHGDQSTANRVYAEEKIKIAKRKWEKAKR